MLTLTWLEEHVTVVVTFGDNCALTPKITRLKRVRASESTRVLEDISEVVSWFLSVSMRDVQVGDKVVRIRRIHGGKRWGGLTGKDSTTCELGSRVQVRPSKRHLLEQ